MHASAAFVRAAPIAGVANEIIDSLRGMRESRFGRDAEDAHDVVNFSNR